MRWRPFAIGAAVAATWTAVVMVATRQSANVPPEPSSPPGAPAKGSWVYLPIERIWLGPDWRFRAVVALPWYVPSALATPAKAKAYAEEKGFRDVVAFDAPPPDWPRVDGDLWVEATWGKAGEYFDRPAALRYAWVQV